LGRENQRGGIAREWYVRNPSHEEPEECDGVYPGLTHPDVTHAGELEENVAASREWKAAQRLGLPDAACFEGVA
jgi:hypothetical protein